MSCEPITLQRVFNLAWQAFIVEGKPPATLKGQCTYRFFRASTEDPTGQELSKCAIGLALTGEQLDKIAARHMANLPINIIVGRFPDWFQSAEEHWPTGLKANVDTSVSRVCASGDIVRDVFRDAQCSLHDYCLDPRDSSKFVSPDSLRRAYIAFAKRYKLTIPEESDVTKDNASASV